MWKAIRLWIAAAAAVVATSSSSALAAQGSGCMPLTGVVSGVQLSQNINAAIAALLSSNSGATAPANDCSSAPVLGQLWVNTSSSPYTLELYDGGQWLNMGTIDPTTHIWSPVGSVLAADVGVIKAYAGTVAPANHLMAFGQCVSKTTYANLYAVVGDAWTAVDGCTTGNFGIPDLRGRAVAGADNMGGTAAGRLTSTTIPGGASLSASGGAQTHLITTSEMPWHNHTINDPGHGHSVGDPSHAHIVEGSSGSVGGPGFGTGVAGTATVSTSNSYTGIWINSSSTGISVNGAGGGGAALSLVQPTMVLNYIIRY